MDSIICGTGHRPDKLGGYHHKESILRLQEIAEQWLLIHKPRLVISGGALGWDQILASAAYVEGIPFHMYLPFADFDSKWQDGDRRGLAWLCNKAERVLEISTPGYHPHKMQERNEAMVDDAEIVLAMWNGTPGGTANCVAYAERTGKPVINLWKSFSNGKEDS